MHYSSECFNRSIRLRLAAGCRKAEVCFRLHVSERGSVAAVTILKSTGYRSLDSEAIETFMLWVARRGERREVDVPLTFTLSGGYKNRNPPTPPGKMDGSNLLGR
jgi:TonB family protein